MVRTNVPNKLGSVTDDFYIIGLIGFYKIGF